MENKNEKIRILLIEDEEKDVQAISDYIRSVADMELAGITNDSNEAVLLTKEIRPHIVILDLELSYGYGSGLSYLKNLSELESINRPKIIVTTKIHNEDTLEIVRELGADFVLYKRQKGYKPEVLISTARLLLEHSRIRPNAIPESSEISKSKENKNEIIMKKIFDEFRFIGLSAHLKGSKYLADAIYIVTTADAETSKSFRQLVYPPLVKKYKLSIENMHRNMMNAIDRTWRLGDPEILTKYYTQHISRDMGSPTVSEFVYYYAQKISSEVIGF